MEKIIFAGKITHIEVKVSQTGSEFLSFKVERKSIWLDKATNSWKQQVISKAMVSGFDSHIQMFKNGLLRLNDFVVIEGNPRIETFTNTNNETKASLKINPINIENLSWIDIQLQ